MLPRAAALRACPVVIARQMRHVRDQGVRAIPELPPHLARMPEGLHRYAPLMRRAWDSLPAAEQAVAARAQAERLAAERAAAQLEVLAQADADRAAGGRRRAERVLARRAASERAAAERRTAAERAAADPAGAELEAMLAAAAETSGDPAAPLAPPRPAPAYDGETRQAPLAGHSRPSG